MISFNTYSKISGIKDCENHEMIPVGENGQYGLVAFKCPFCNPHIVTFMAKLVDRQNKLISKFLVDSEVALVLNACFTVLSISYCCMATMLVIINIEKINRQFDRLLVLRKQMNLQEIFWTQTLMYIPGVRKKS